MQLDRQAEGAGGAEDAFGLLGREGDPFAEGVDGIRQAGRGDGGKHRAADLVDEGVAVAGRLGRQRMCAQERGDDANRPRLAQAARSSLTSLSRSRP